MHFPGRSSRFFMKFLFHPADHFAAGRKTAIPKSSGIFTRVRDFNCLQRRAAGKGMFFYFKDFPPVQIAHSMQKEAGSNRQLE